MKSNLTFKFSFAAILFLIAGMLPHQLMGQAVNVKMRINTSTCLDTLSAKHMLLMCGESKLGGLQPSLTWEAKTSGIAATNKGGDYWEINFRAKPGDEIKYKFVAMFDRDHPTFHWSGWEGPIEAGVSSGDNRLLVLGSKDTTLDLQYFNGWETKVKQYWRPFESKKDTIAVYFRVNMGGSNLDPAKDKVDVRGGLPFGAEPSWISFKMLSQETNSVNQGSFWSGVAYVAKSAITGNPQQKFKFVYGNNWESTPDRVFTFSNNLLNVTGDTTLAWVYFNNQPPRGKKVTHDVLFRLKLQALEKAGLFNWSLGDRIGLTGAKGWAPAEPVFDTEPTMLKMTYNSDLEEWNLVEPFTLYAGEVLNYKYYIAWDTSRVSPSNKNYIPGLMLTNGWEEPGVSGGADRKYTYLDADGQVVAGDFGAEQQFFNSLHPNSVITTPIKVTFTIDMAPAADAVSNPTRTLFRPGVDSVFVQFDGSFVPVTQGKTMYGTDNRLLLEDKDGDGKYTGEYSLNPPTFNQFCYRITYTTSTGNSETNGGGILAGRRYYQYAKPTKVEKGGIVTWPSTYALAPMTWKNDNLTIETPPDLDTPTGVRDNNTVPGIYALNQNYPNPFNPSTVITYSTAENAMVRIQVFNLLGQKVATLVDQEQSAGTHSLEWNAQDYMGSKLATGIYLLKMETGAFSRTIKMMLMK
ncbi:MAG: T9SS type A sorting domain-containing protein [Syntrophomonadaceae bacterium]